MNEDLSAIEETRKNIFKNRFTKVIMRREKKVIDRLVDEYRDGLLTADKAFSAIMAIAELRWAGSDIEKKDFE